MSRGWLPTALPDLSGKTFIITGGNGGLGVEAAKLLTGKGGRVVITSRSAPKAEAAITAIQEHVPGAEVSSVLLDLADPESIRRAAKELVDATPNLSAILNNAGVMQTPETRTKEGFELQFSTNHLGHFRLNAQMFPHLESCGARIVPVSSVAHRLGKIHFDDLMFEKHYNATTVYSQSKLANLMYAFELDRRLQARNSACMAIPCHPGYANTNLQSAGVGMKGGSGLLKAFYSVTNRLVAQSAEQGAYPLVLAAADPEAERGVYYGPTHLMDSCGPVGRSTVAKHARDEEVAARLWEATEALVGPFFPEGSTPTYGAAGSS